MKYMVNVSYTLTVLSKILLVYCIIYINNFEQNIQYVILEYCHTVSTFRMIRTALAPFLDLVKVHTALINLMHQSGEPIYETAFSRWRRLYLEKHYVLSCAVLRACVIKKAKGLCRRANDLRASNSNYAHSSAAV